MTDTDKILAAIQDSSDKVHETLGDHERRLQKLETAVTVHGLKIGAIVATIMAFGGIIWNVIKDQLGIK